MRVFVTGVTGYIGGAVAEALLAAGHEVTGLIRPERDKSALERAGIQPFRGTLGEPEDLAEEAKKVDATIHTAFDWGPNGALADAAFVDRVLGALEGSDKSFVYTSGVWVMGNTKKGADEDSPLSPPSLAAARVPLERKVIAAAGRGIRSVVIRPATVYGRGRGLVAPLLKSARETGAAIIVGTGENHWTFVHIDDLARLYVLALNAEPGSLFIAAHGPALRVHEVAQAASKAAGAEGRTQTWLLEEAFHEMGPLVEGLVLDQQVSGERAVRVLGWKPQAPSVLDDIRHGSYAAH